MPKTRRCLTCDAPCDRRATHCRTCASRAAGFTPTSSKAALNTRESNRAENKALAGLMRHALAEYRAGRTRTIEEIAREAGIK